jgi:hypothetical protein
MLLATEFKKEFMMKYFSFLKTLLGRGVFYLLYFFLFKQKPGLHDSRINFNFSIKYYWLDLWKYSRSFGVCNGDCAFLQCKFLLLFLKQFLFIQWGGSFGEAKQVIIDFFNKF